VRLDLMLLLLATSPRPPRPTRFPYTTLFRSTDRMCPKCGRPKAASQGNAGNPFGDLLGGIFEVTFAQLGVVIEEAHRRAKTLDRSEEHTSELQSRGHLVCRLLLEKKNTGGIW